MPAAALQRGSKQRLDGDAGRRPDGSKHVAHERGDVGERVEGKVKRMAKPTCKRVEGRLAPPRTSAGRGPRVEGGRTWGV